MIKSVKGILAVSVICLVIVIIASCAKSGGGKGNTPMPGDLESGNTPKISTVTKAEEAPTRESTPTPKATPTPEPTPTPTPTPKPYTVVLDPGHGGVDPGACSKGYEEADLTLKIAGYCRDYLLENYDTIEVYMTREEDVHLSKDKVEDLKMRCELARDVGADCLVSIHLNASEKHKLHGAEIYVSKRDNVGEATVTLAGFIMDELVELGFTNRGIATRKSNDMFDENGVSYDYYGINRNCANLDVPGIIVEAGFLDNEADQSLLFSEEGMKAVGEAEARGIANYFGAEEKQK